MVVKKSFLALVFVLVSLSKANDFVIRPANLADLPEILELDRKITFEFFKPLYLKSYTHLIEPNKVDYFLNKELANDQEIFPKAINDLNHEKLHIAYDDDKKHIVGFLLFHIEEEIIELDLLLIDKNYRRKGIGKKLIINAIDTFKQAESVIVYPLSIDNIDTLNFYESIGFINFGPSPMEGTNAYGVNYHKMHYYFKLDCIWYRKFF